MVEGPKAGLDALDVLAADARLKGHYRLDAVRAHLLEKAGDREAAVAHYRKAAARTSSVPERNYLVTRAATGRSDHLIFRLRRAPGYVRVATWRSRTSCGSGPKSGICAYGSSVR